VAVGLVIGQWREGNRVPKTDRCLCEFWPVSICVRNGKVSGQFISSFQGGFHFFRKIAFVGVVNFGKLKAIR
jgi:hypothetical protein